MIPKVQKKFYTTIDEEELTRLKQVRFERINFLYQRNNLIFDFLFYSGLRISELVNIKHHDWQDGSLRIYGKNNKLRYVFLPVFLIKKFNFGSPEYLFTTIKGNKVHPESVRRSIQRRVGLAKIEKRITPHSFRRSLATNLHNKGGKLQTIQKQLGHSNIQTTLDYIHNDHNTLYQDYSKLFQETKKTPSPVLKNYSLAELLVEISRRIEQGDGNHA